MGPTAAGPVSPGTRSVLCSSLPQKFSNVLIATPYRHMKRRFATVPLFVEISSVCNQKSNNIRSIVKAAQNSRAFPPPSEASIFAPERSKTLAASTCPSRDATEREFQPSMQVCWDRLPSIEVSRPGARRRRLLHSLNPCQYSSCSLRR